MRAALSLYYACALEQPRSSASSLNSLTVFNDARPLYMQNVYAKRICSYARAISEFRDKPARLSLTYSNMPSYDATSMDSVLVAASRQRYNWSVVDAVRNALNGNPKSVTMIMQEPTLHSSATLSSLILRKTQSTLQTILPNQLFIGAMLY